MKESILDNSVIRRHLTAEQKLAIVRASYAPGVLVTEIARKYKVGLSSLIRWRKYANEGSLMSIKDKQAAVSANDMKRLQKENKQLQRLLGKQALQIEILKEGLAIAREKKLILQQPLPGEEHIVNDS